ncbi:unnamed protein product [Meganyctiphanes norvegica]|uniref:Fibrinogen C-terminal domain-containing protein n=1 Tax=Meganyctiphanes norvegica TaxID=48144 RepID=A0AAV2RGU5_MEGNR
MMLAKTVLFLSSCFAFALGTVTQTNVNISTGRPHDCQDLIHQGNTYEGHYVVYPDTDAPSRPSMIHCSVHDGMEPLPSDTDNEPARNCHDLLQDGITTSGVNVIYPYLDHPADPVLVLCDQVTDGGGWTVIQHRFDGTEDFFRTWAEYIFGFGNVAEEHYLGNDKIVALTLQCVNELRVDLEAWDGTTAYANYDSFHIDPRFDYQLQVYSYKGTAGDSLMDDHNGQSFSTFDADHDVYGGGNCAEEFHGAWWYKACHRSNLNGRYYPSDDYTDHTDGLMWFDFQGVDSLKTTKMMIRPYAFTAAAAAHTGGLHDTEADVVGPTQGVHTLH